MTENQRPRVVAKEILFEQQHLDSPVEDAVTVVVSLYNYERYITECLDSVAQSIDQELELVVVDDASNRDASADVTRQWMQDNQARFTRSTLLRHKANQGLAQARNTAFDYARTNSVFVMDADNQVYPKAISRLNRFVAGRGYDVAYSQVEWFGDVSRLGLADIWSKERLSRGNYVDAMALVSKRAWQRVGGYDHIEGGWEDYDFWCKFIESGLEGIYIPEILCRYRVHGESMISSDTWAVENRLRVELTLRHPWLKLKTKPVVVEETTEVRDPRHIVKSTR